MCDPSEKSVELTSDIEKAGEGMLTDGHSDGTGNYSLAEARKGGPCLIRLETEWS